MSRESGSCSPGGSWKAESTGRNDNHPVRRERSKAIPADEWKKRESEAQPGSEADGAGVLDFGDLSIGARAGVRGGAGLRRVSQIRRIALPLQDRVVVDQVEHVHREG